MAFASASADLKLAFLYHFSMKLQMHVIFHGDFLCGDVDKLAGFGAGNAF